MWYGKFLVGKDCSKECYKESSTMITREGRQYGRTLFNYIFNKECPRGFLDTYRSWLTAVAEE